MPEPQTETPESELREGEVREDAAPSVSATLSGTSSGRLPRAHEAYEDESAESTGLTLIEDIRIGRGFNDVRILRVIHTGGAAVVYEGLDQEKKRRVAVKFLPEALRRKDLPSEPLFAEAVAASALGHPHIGIVYGTGRDGGACYLVMELERPRSAADVLRAKGRIHWAEATTVVSDCCAALEAAHSAEIFHGAIKPSNILCSAEGKTKLVDFGMAKEFRRPQLASAEAALAYESPEQRRGEPQGASSDLYSLGATYYTLLTGELPVQSSPQNEPPDPRNLSKMIPEVCSKIIARAMANESSVRYSRAAEMLADLDAALRDATAFETDFLIAGDPSEQIMAMGSRGVHVLSTLRAKSLTLSNRTMSGKGESSPPRSLGSVRALAKSERPPSSALVSKQETEGKNPWKLISILLAVALVLLIVVTLLGK